MGSESTVGRHVSGTMDGQQLPINLDSTSVAQAFGKSPCDRNEAADASDPASKFSDTSDATP